MNQEKDVNEYLNGVKKKAKQDGLSYLNFEFVPLQVLEKEYSNIEACWKHVHGFQEGWNSFIEQPMNMLEFQRTKEGIFCNVNQNMELTYDLFTCVMNLYWHIPWCLENIGDIRMYYTKEPK